MFLNASLKLNKEMNTSNFFFFNQILSCHLCSEYKKSYSSKKWPNWVRVQSILKLVSDIWSFCLSTKESKTGFGTWDVVKSSGNYKNQELSHILLRLVLLNKVKLCTVLWLYTELFTAAFASSQMPYCFYIKIATKNDG